MIFSGLKGVIHCILVELVAKKIQNFILLFAGLKGRWQKTRDIEANFSLVFRLAFYY